VSAGTPIRLPRPRALQALDRDGQLLFATRVVRMFAYGFLSVVLALYLVAAGLTEIQIGLLLTLTLVGDTAISIWITTSADRVGRRRMLVVGALLMVFGGALFALTGSLWLLLLAAIVGVISPGGGEVGPFLPIEQSALAQTVRSTERTGVFAWYNLVGSFATALGALAGGTLAQGLQSAGVSTLLSYRWIVVGYALLGLSLALVFTRLTARVEATTAGDRKAVASGVTRLGLHRSSGVVLHLSALFALDSFAGGFTLQSIVAYWFYLRFGAEPGLLGGIFFAANLLAGVSALAAASVASRIGLVNTMVFTHLPSNLLLMLVPLMPSLPLAVAVLLLRFSISQMDVPPRQAYVMAVVSPDERSSAAGITGSARTIGSSLSPMLVGPLLANPSLLGMPFFLCGGLKVVYDLLLYRRFRAVRVRDESAAESRSGTAG
jgi:MFS family permease